MALVVLTGCGPDREQPSPEQPSPTVAAETSRAVEILSFELGERSYAIPASYVRALRIGGDDSFVRIKVPDFPAEIVVDEKSSGKADKTGAPQIFSINDRDYPRLNYTKRDGDKAVVCRTGMAAQSGCGTLFDHAGVEWTLLFPIGLRDRADELVEQSEQLLDRLGNGRENDQKNTSGVTQQDAGE